MIVYMDKSSIASRLRSERTRTGLTQAEMADRMMLPHVTYRSYESGRSMPPLSFFERLLSAQLDATYVATGRAVIFDGSEQDTTLARKRKKQTQLSRQPQTIEDALSLIRKLLQQSRVDDSHQEPTRGKAA